MAFLDDKCSIPIGDYDSPVSAVQRQRKQLDPKTSDATDHDHISMHLTPSVINVFNKPPRNISDSFYGGVMQVVLKCAIFESSSAKRHMVELEKAMASMDAASPIQLIYTDGGGDHRTPFISVQKGYIAHFLKMDLDMLVAARTPPNFSVLNPIERAMSVINLALYGLALARKRFSDKIENRLNK